MKGFWLVLLALCVFGMHGMAFGAQSYTVAVDVANPPFSYRNAQGKLAGFNVDIAEALCTRMHIECRIVPVLFNSVLDAVVSGRADFAVAGMVATKEREEVVLFSDKYYQSHSLVLQRTGQEHKAGTSLEGMKVGAENGTIHYYFLQRQYSSSACIFGYDTGADLYAALKDKTLDFALVDGLSVGGYLQSPEGESFEPADIFLRAEDFLQPSRIVLNKSLEHLLQPMNESLTHLRHSGEYDRINRKYFNQSIY